MARPIKPTQLRRLDADGPIEVMNSGGLWVEYDLLAWASQEAVRTACRQDGFDFGAARHNRNMVFHHTFGTPREDMVEQPTPNHTDNTDYDPRNDDGDGDGNAEAEAEADDGNGGSGDGSGGGDSLTIEDIIRRIAGGMDDELGVELVRMVEDRFEKFTHKLPDNDFTPIRRVEIVRNDVVMPHDGVFHNQFPKLVRAVSAGQHCYLPGPPGSGKSHAAEQVASVLGWRFASLSLGPTTPESRLWGGMDANGNFFEPPFVALARHAMDSPDSGAIYCLDEMDNGHAGIIATLNSALANGWFTAPCGDRITMGRNFVIVAAANTYGTGPTARFAGRNKLDAATLDRFAYLPWDTDTTVETTMVKSILHGDNDLIADAWLDAWRTLRSNVTENGLEFFVTMRGALNGARLIAAGFPMTDAMDMVIGSKMPDNQWVRVNPL